MNATAGWSGAWFTRAHTSADHTPRRRPAARVAAKQRLTTPWASSGGRAGHGLAADQAEAQRDRRVARSASGKSVPGSASLASSIG